MQIVPSLKVCTKFVGVAVLLAISKPSVAKLDTLPVVRQLPEQTEKASSSTTETSRTKTNVPGEFIGPEIDCDGDGLDDESRIVFPEAGVNEECVAAPEEIPEPPFQQTYVPTRESFNSLLPAVGWQAIYQCGDGLYEVTLSRPAEDKIQYRSQGLSLTSDIVYDDIDPNLNQPLVIQDPEDGIRYTFEQAQAGEFYEYAIADYSGNVGLYIYQTGEQIVAAPCSATNGSATNSSATAQ